MENYPFWKQPYFQESIGGATGWGNACWVGMGIRITGSIFSEASGEGMIVSGDAVDGAPITIEDCISYNNYSVNIYYGSDNVTVRRCIVLDDGVDENINHYYYAITSTQLASAKIRTCPDGIMTGVEAYSPGDNSSESTYVYNNIVVGCRSGFKPYNEVDPYLIKNGYIYNNTIILPTGSNADYYGIHLGNGNVGNANNFIKNNIIIGNNSSGKLIRYGTAGGGVTFSNNCYYHPNSTSPFYYATDSTKTYAEWVSILNLDHGTQETGSKNENPDLAMANYSVPDLASYLAGIVTDIYLTAVSPCRDAGTVLGSPYDIDFNNVNRGASYDMGAFEYTEGIPEGTIIFKNVSLGGISTR